MRTLYLFLLTILYFGCGADGDTPAGDALADIPVTTAVETGRTYPTETVELKDVDRPIQLTGRVIPVQEAVISSQVPGQVLSTNKILQEGKAYKRGEVMIRIDDEPLRYSLRAERSQLVTALVRLLSDLSFDYPEEHLVWEKFTNGIRPEERLPDLPEIENDQLRYFINANNIPAQYYAIKAREATLDDYTIRSPFSGQLTAAGVQPGSVVQPGQQLARISRTDVYEMRAALPAAAVNLFGEGRTLRLFSRNLNREYTGTIDRFSSEIDPTTQTVTAFVRLAGPGLRTGLYLEGELPGESLTSVAVLPQEALTREQEVYVIENSVVKRKPVTVVAIESDKVYLRDLVAGDRVITAAVSAVVLGTRAQ